MSDSQIFVTIELNGINHLVGKLWYHRRASRHSTSFTYDQSWLANPERFALEPALSLTEGTFHSDSGKILFGSFGDSAPDRWGRVLMRRAEALRARKLQEVPKTLSELDYLLGVNDVARQGALRFSYNKDGDYLADPNEQNIPPFIKLTDLLAATNNYLSDKDNEAALKLLLAPGSSLGGARPKATILDRDGSLTIAKFARPDDEINQIKWEALALTLAKDAGLNTAKWHIENILNQQVLLLQRFDRDAKKRIPFLSAMSMLGAKDNEPRSYLEIAYAIQQYSAAPQQDLVELWRRIIFTILISNTDDHLRNHGFLYEGRAGWRLSPAYDLNPTAIVENQRILATSINYDDPTASLVTAFEVLEEFRIQKADAHKIVKQVLTAVLKWREVAKKLGISKQEINYMAGSFEHEDLKLAKQKANIS